LSPEGSDPAVIMFPSGSAKRPEAAAAVVRRPMVPVNTPTFLVTRDRETASRWESLKAIFTRIAPSSSNSNIYLFRANEVGRFELARKPLSASFILHCCAIIVLVVLHRAFPPSAFADAPPARDLGKIYYTVPQPLTKQPLMHIAPAGPGGKPASGFVPDVPPALGSTSKYGDLTVVSKPDHHDNFHQTIIQPNSPPDLIIKQDLKLPNIVIGKPADSPKAAFKANDAKPTKANREYNADPAPTVASVVQQPELTTFLPPSNTTPKLAIPVAAPSAPARPSAHGDPGGASGSGSGSPGEANGLIVIGTDPAPPGSSLVMPPGNRYGEFTLSPNGGTPGSPGGDPNGTVGGGSGGHGSGGDGSTGLGTGGVGGGGGNSGSPGYISINGNGEGGGSGSLNGGNFSAGMVYPVAIVSTQLRRNSLVVSAGSIGGGGLDVYNVLHCGKIYTIYLQMPTSNWAMQYCQKTDPNAKRATQQPNNVIHLEQGLLPPTIETQFDFKRLPVPEEKAHRKIVLKGTLKEDGSVVDLQIFQGVLPQMDEAARLALSQWKFKPAMRNGKAIPVEILVGIPAVVSE
jgi:hypothetical protein